MTSTSLCAPTAAAFPLTPPTVAPGAGLGVHPRRGFRLRWRHVVLGGFLACGLLVTALVLSFRMGGEAKVLRRAAFAAAPDPWERQFEFGIGRLPVLLARAALAFAPLEPEARTALNVLRSADVGIYQRRPSAPGLDRDAVLSGVQQAMDREGWEPLVLMREAKEIVAVFVPKVTRSASQLNTCLLVLDGDDLVLVSARANLDPLITLALEATDDLPGLLRE